MVLNQVSSSYEHALQSVYYDIGNRGIRVDVDRIEHAKKIVISEISRNLAIASNQWGCKVFIGAENAPTEEEEEDSQELIDDPDIVAAFGPSVTERAVNLNATQGKYALMGKLKELGYAVPKIPKKNEEGEYEAKYSAGELALQKMLSANQFQYPGGDPALRAILEVRELSKLKSSYLNARLFGRGQEYFFLTNYNVAGTLSGRRSSRRHTFGFGNNAQNIPKHSKIAQLYRRCLCSRSGHVFLLVDQIQAEDWPVSALSGNMKALQELKDGVDRHTALASFIFNIPVDSRSKQEWKDSMERYLGKKCRHASNYDMTAPRMSDALAQEGKSIGIKECEIMLQRVALAEPLVKQVFHQYVKDCINKDRILRSPTGRERQFLGFRPNDANNSLLKEGYSFIPQCTVGDNTGFSVLSLETKYAPEERYIVQEGHDSIAQDTPCDVETIYRTGLRTQEAFRRTFRFYNGIEIEIPIEAELGFDFQTTVKLKAFERTAIKEALEELRDKKAAADKAA
jgi:hypothetical protein